MSIWLEIVLAVVAVVVGGVLVYARLRSLRIEVQLAPELHAITRATGRLEDAASDARTAALVLASNAEVSKMLAEQDRNQLARLVRLLDVLDDKVVAAGLAAEGVAADLADARGRADAAAGPHGAAADAAMSTGTAV